MMSRLPLLRRLLRQSPVLTRLTAPCGWAFRILDNGLDPWMLEATLATPWVRVVPHERHPGRVQEIILCSPFWRKRVAQQEKEELEVALDALGVPFQCVAMPHPSWAESRTLQPDSQEIDAAGGPDEKTQQWRPHGRTAY